ncbi:MAG: hypothetical protein ACK595_13505 [Planctomycetota bacterium]
MRPWRGAGGGRNGPIVIACTSDEVSGQGAVKAVSKQTHWLWTTAPVSDWSFGRTKKLLARANMRDGLDATTSCVTSGSNQSEQPGTPPMRLSGRG